MELILRDITRQNSYFVLIYGKYFPVSTLSSARTMLANMQESGDNAGYAGDTLREYNTRLDNLAIVTKGS